jgi:hypothetical protein
MRRAEIEEQNGLMVRRQRDFRIAADVAADAWSRFPEVAAVAVTGSVARPLWKELPRFREFRRAGIEVWHECQDLDLAVWLESQANLGALRPAVDHALRRGSPDYSSMQVASSQLDVFLLEPGTDRYLGRLCRFSTCPKQKIECAVPGCGTIPFNRIFRDFVAEGGLVTNAAMLYRRGEGIVCRAVDLPGPDESR